jgi:hypothetical protein
LKQYLHAILESNVVIMQTLNAPAANIEEAQAVLKHQATLEPDSSKALWDNTLSQIVMWAAAAFLTVGALGSLSWIQSNLATTKAMDAATKEIAVDTKKK